MRRRGGVRRRDLWVGGHALGGQVGVGVDADRYAHAFVRQWRRWHKGAGVSWGWQPADILRVRTRASREGTADVREVARTHDVVHVHAFVRRWR